MPTLDVVRSLLDAFHNRDVRYCHWKSNEHLLAGMSGDTDLDILVDRDQSAEVQEILAHSGFKRFLSAPGAQYPAVEDYVAFDERTGKLAHFHLHYRLMLGEKHLKGYRLPWERRLLETRKFDSIADVYIVDPHIELILLLVRAAIKIRTRDFLRACFGINYVKQDDLAEFHWLIQRTQSKQNFQIASELLGEQAAKQIGEILSGSLTMHRLRRLRCSARATLQQYRMFGTLAATSFRWARELSWLVRGVNKRYLHFPMTTGRRIPSGGLIVVVLGCDGCGKSTASKVVMRWLSWKLHPIHIYMGSGDGPSSLLRWPMKIVAALTRCPVESHGASNRAEPVRERPDPPQRGFRQWIRLFGKTPWALVLAQEKRGKLRTAGRASDRGMVVVCDRFPQCQIMGFNDGPLLSHWLDHRSRWRQSLARWEGRCYQLAQECPPDLVIKLNVSPEVALQRKDDMSLAEVLRRIDAVKSLRFPDQTEVVEINADEPLESVLSQVKHAIWRKI